jgi:hypothetical protein
MRVWVHGKPTITQGFGATGPRPMRGTKPASYLGVQEEPAMTSIVTRARSFFARALRRDVRIILGSAALSAAAVLVCAWPAATQAGDIYETVEQEQAAQDELFRDASQFGSLRVATRLVADEHNPKRFYLEILARNTTSEGAESADVAAVVERTVYSPMDRGAPPPTVAWTVQQTLRVEPGKVAVQRVAVPAGIALRIYKSQQPPKLNEYGNPVGPQTAYASNISELKPARPSAPGSVSPHAGGAKALSAPAN